MFRLADSPGTRSRGEVVDRRLPLVELALLHEGRRMATLRAVTPCRVAVVPKGRIDRQALEEIAKGRIPQPER